MRGALLAVLVHAGRAVGRGRRAVFAFVEERISAVGALVDDRLVVVGFALTFRVFILEFSLLVFQTLLILLILLLMGRL